jgi:hypothetical protein
MPDFSTLPLPQNFILAVLLYSGASFIAGQFVGDRTIDKSGWIARCETAIKESVQSQIATKREDEALVPDTDCQSLIGRWHPDLNRLCGEFGNPDFGGFDARVAREAERRARELEHRQLEAAAAGAGSQCECAAAVYRRENMIGLAVYAGSARLFTAPQISNMRSGLQDALGNPLCANLAGGL